MGEVINKAAETAEQQDFWVGIWYNLTHDSGTIVTVATVLILAMVLIVLLKICQINPAKESVVILRWFGQMFGKLIGKKEAKYHREMEIGKLNKKKTSAKLYKFLNDLIIDLGLKKRGATPYAFYYLIWAIAILASVLLCQLVFMNPFLAIVLSPIMFLILMCGCYTKANLAHDRRIESVMESENIISNNIKDGVVVAIRNSIDMIPINLRADFKDFLDNVEFKGYHIKTALLELNNNLGSITDDFIKKCIVFEMEEERGIAGMFQDIIEVNNIKAEMRLVMKRKFEKVIADFTVGTVMIFVFLGGVIGMFDVVRTFYFRNSIGQIIICIDILILAIEFVYITILRATEI